MRKIIIIISLFAICLSSYAGGNANDTDTLQQSIGIQDTFVIEKDDPVLLALEEHLSDAFRNYYCNQIDSSVCQAPLHDSIKTFSDDYYREKLRLLDEETPFRLAYNNKVAAFINLYVNKKTELTERVLGLAELYFPLFEEILDKYDLPLEFKYLAVVESALRPTARSRSGAMGLWQFMYHTGKLYGLKVTSYVDERRDPVKSTEAACKYFQYLYKKYHDWDLVMAAYNCGPGNVNKAIRRSGGKTDYWELWPYLPRETRGYVPAFIAVNYVMENYAAHGLHPIPAPISYFETDTVWISKSIGFKQISETLNIDIELLRALNPAYKMDYIPVSSAKASLFLPKDKIGLFVLNEDKIYEYKKIEDEKELEPVLAQDKRIVHTVRSGDVLGVIAQRYGCSISDIKQWNNLHSSRIYPGQKLIIYSSKTATAHKTNHQSSKSKPNISVNNTTKYYIIQKGDTLWDIAKATGISVEKLKQLNRGLNYKKLKPGTKIKLSNEA
ncbi:MAG: LysM peptidoglycan-binding domain-containing protein [Bacteroidetes bacterium]|nr:MAG: LysM peptidoglycan-binding domain-containing protein [Bacteroidota bacterium]